MFHLFPSPRIHMPYGASPKEFAVTIFAAFLSAAAGSSIVHAIMKPNETPADFSSEVEARSRAIREMQQEIDPSNR
jgi:hypothetical protein